MYKVTFNLQDKMSKVGKASHPPLVEIAKCSDLDAQIDLEVTTTLEKIGRQNKVSRVINKGVENAYTIEIWLGSEEITTVTGKPNKKAKLALTVALASGLGLATLDAKEWKNDGGNKYSKKAIKAQEACHVIVDKDRVHLHASDTLREIAKTFDKELGDILSLKPSKGYKRESQAKGTSTTVKFICSTDCEVVKTGKLRINGHTEAVALIRQSLGKCGECGHEFNTVTVSETTPQTVLAEATEIIQETAELAVTT